MPTVPCQRFIDACKARWAGLTYQVFNCRRIAGTSSWSQHAFANAVDIFGQERVLDEVARYARSRSDVRTVLWQVRDHYDHVHVDFHPKGTNTPPCAGGTGGPTPADPTGEWPLSMMTTLRKGMRHPHVALFQTILNGTSEIENRKWPHVNVDGAFGDHTHNVTLMFQDSRGLKADGVVGRQTWTKALAL